MALSQEVIYYDDFTSDKGLKTEDSYGFSSYNYGYLEFGSISLDNISTIDLNKYINVNSDFQIEVTMKFEKVVDWSSNGIMWGRGFDWQNYFIFGLSGNGFFRVRKKFKGSFFEFVTSTASKYIKKNDYNKLTMRKVSNEYYFFINEFFVYRCLFEPFYGDNNSIYSGPNSTARLSKVNIEYLSNLEHPEVYNVTNQKANVIIDKSENNFNEILPGVQLITSEEDWLKYSPTKACCCYPEFDEKNKSLGLLYNYNAYQKVYIYLHNQNSGSTICSKTQWEDIFSKLKSNQSNFNKLNLNFYPGFYDEIWYTPKDNYAGYWVDENTLVSFSNDALAEPMIDENVVNDGNSNRQSLIALAIRVTNSTSSSCDFSKWNKENVNVRGSKNKIKFVSKLSDWKLYSPIEPCCCYINFDLNNDSYGFLYNYQAYQLLKNDPSLKEQGYRVATENDWNSVVTCVKSNGDYKVLFNCEGENYLGLNLVPNGCFYQGSWTLPEKGYCNYWTTKLNDESVIEFNCANKNDIKISQESLPILHINQRKSLSAYMIRFIKL